MESNSVCNHATDKQNRTSPICSIKSMITDQIRRHEGLLPINHNHFNFLEKKSFFCKRAFNTNYRKKYITNSSILENPQFGKVW